jgi:hypothetical protein
MGFHLLAIALVSNRLFLVGRGAKLIRQDRQEAQWLRSIAFAQKVFGAGMSPS